MLNLFPQTATSIAKFKEHFNEALGRDVEAALSFNSEVAEVNLKVVRVFSSREGWHYLFEVKVFVENSLHQRELSWAHTDAMRDALKVFPFSACAVAAIFGPNWEKQFFRKKDGSVYSFSYA